MGNCLKKEKVHLQALEEEQVQREQKKKETLLRQKKRREENAKEHPTSFLKEEEPRKEEIPIHDRISDITDYYQPLGPIGQGGFARVVKMKRNSDGLVVAMKVIPISSLGLDERDALSREVESLLLLSHPNIIRLIEVFKSSTSVYMALEFCRGGNLEDYILEHGPLSESETQYIIYQTLKAIGFAHSKGFAHRDLKPANIFLVKRDSLDQIKLGDWGFAKNFSNNLLDTARGTPLYSPPEMIEAEVERDERTDIWSLGVMTYQLMSCTLPFEVIDEDDMLDVLKTYEKITKLEYTFDPKWQMYPDARNFVQSLLVPLDKRPFASGLLYHPWFRDIKNLQTTLSNSSAPVAQPVHTEPQHPTVIGLENWKQYKHKLDKNLPPLDEKVIDYTPSPRMVRNNELMY